MVIKWDTDLEISIERYLGSATAVALLSAVTGYRHNPKVRIENVSDLPHCYFR
jgi:hypothetical protein